MENWNGWNHFMCHMWRRSVWLCFRACVYVHVRSTNYQMKAVIYLAKFLFTANVVFIGFFWLVLTFVHNSTYCDRGNWQNCHLDIFFITLFCWHIKANAIHLLNDLCSCCVFHQRNCTNIKCDVCVLVYEYNNSPVDSIHRDEHKNDAIDVLCLRTNRTIYLLLLYICVNVCACVQKCILKDQKIHRENENM